jgi:hypothetical protein
LVLPAWRGGFFFQPHILQCFYLPLDEEDEEPLPELLELDDEPLPFPELLELLEELELLPFFFLPGAASVKLWVATAITKTTSFPQITKKKKSNQVDKRCIHRKTTQT